MEKRISIMDKTRKKVFLLLLSFVFILSFGWTASLAKTTIEFISIAYSDLFGNTISQNTLTELSIAYLAFGDKKLVEDLIIRNFLNTPGVVIPTKTEMNADVSLFVSTAFKKFYNREPNEFELWQLVELITKDSAMTPELVYYAFMTSNEYRYY